MIPPAVHALLVDPSEEEIDRFLECEAVGWIDWRAEPSDVLDEVRQILGIELAAPARGLGEKPHEALVLLNEHLSPRYEIRACKDSSGMDSLAVLALSASDWRDLEERYGASALDARFYAIQPKPDLFEDPEPY